MPKKSWNCLGSVNRAVDRVVCHPAALGWHRRATDDTLPGTELCFYQLSGQRPPPDCIGDKREQRGLLAPPLGNRDIYEERMGPTWCMDAGPRLLGNRTAQTIAWSWKCTATAFQTLTWLLRRLLLYSPYKYNWVKDKINQKMKTSVIFDKGFQLEPRTKGFQPEPFVRLKMKRGTFLTSYFSTDSYPVCHCLVNNIPQWTWVG